MLTQTIPRSKDNLPKTASATSGRPAAQLHKIQFYSHTHTHTLAETGAAGSGSKHTLQLQIAEKKPDVLHTRRIWKYLARAVASWHLSLGKR